MKESVKKLILGSSVVAAITASLCCILPVLAVVFGLGAFSMASFFETLRPYLLILVLLALAFGFYQTYFRREKCGEGHACATKPIGRFNQLVLWAATVFVFVIAAFPFYSGYIVSALDKSPTAESNQAEAVNENENPIIENQNEETAESELQTRKTVVIAVEGMTCEGCAAQLNVALKRLKGVISAEANYPQKNVKVVYNPKQVTVERIKKAIYDAGYTPK